MNQQFLATSQQEIDAPGGSSEPFPTIEPELVERLAHIDDPIVDTPPPTLLSDPGSIEFIPATMARAPDDFLSSPAPLTSEPVAEGNLVAHVGRPISSVMDQILWTVHAEDSIEKVEEILGQQNLTSAPVVGSNGAIVGMISHQELAQFHLDGKNGKAVQAWEIARIKLFEVSPNDTVEDVAKLMTENKIENICVTEFGQLKGIVSAQGLLTDMLNALPDASGQ